MSKSFGDIDMNVCNNNAHTPYKKIIGFSINSGDYTGLIEIRLDDDYEYKLEMNRLYALKKKPKYPTTYEECCDIIECCIYTDFKVPIILPYDAKIIPLLENIRKLLICRDTYWDIAGDEMGLGKSWDSTYGCGEWGYWIGYSINENKIYLQDSRILVNHILVFPTEKMRDAFYENFKDLIEQCKELL